MTLNMAWKPAVSFFFLGGGKTTDNQSNSSSKQTNIEQKEMFLHVAPDIKTDFDASQSKNTDTK